MILLTLAQERDFIPRSKARGPYKRSHPPRIQTYTSDLRYCSFSSWHLRTPDLTDIKMCSRNDRGCHNKPQDSCHDKPQDSCHRGGSSCHEDRGCQQQPPVVIPAPCIPPVVIPAQCPKQPPVVVPPPCIPPVVIPPSCQQQTKQTPQWPQQQK
ncbi:Hypothetical predicted protein [Podarcis lilfordi]|uniref:Uncharacterized protein n=1 Tax=Podarcis lilfordi TaxID=74358 RepID=A0AA35PVN2_9SAUR|nr:Hypothetical predicted protein [Podarcis lilfordi]